MSNQVESKACALEKLLASLLEERSQLEFSASILPGRVNFRGRVPAAVAGRLVGYSGSHLRAIQLVTECIGNAMGQQWVFDLDDPEDERRVPLKEDKTPDDHDCTDDALMLANLLEACGVEALVDFNGGIAGGFDFWLETQRQQDDATLLDPHPAIYRRNQRLKDPLNLLVAIRILFRCIGKKSGVDYRVSIA